MTALFGGGGGNEAQKAREEEAKRQARIREGTVRINSTFDKNFDKSYFDKQRDNYLSYASPQVEDQYGKAQKELTFALARSGNLDSSSRAEKVGELQKLHTLNQQTVGDQALAYRGKARSNVEDARSGLIATLTATGDAQGAANSAISRASALSEPTAYSPLSQLFTDFTAGLGTQAALERANYYSGGQVPVRYNTGLFAPSASAVQVK